LEGDKMLNWFLLAGNEPEKLKTLFVSFFSSRNFPQGITLWKWKKTCWISSPENFQQDILTTFKEFGIVEFSSAPCSSDLEFIFGDNKSNNSIQAFGSPEY
jgi:hypothetical protein